jgi:Na+/H+ antiporter NhaC
MPLPVTLVLMVFWLVLAYRRFEAGDMLLAGVFAAVGIVITIYRLRAAASAAQNSNPRPK